MIKKTKKTRERRVAKRKVLEKALNAAPKTKKNLKATMDEIQENGLSMKEEIFCRCYATSREFFGNGVQSYIEAYKPDMSKKGWYNVARNMAYRLLTKGDIMKRINELLDPEGWNHGNMDKQLLFVANQFGDLKSKVNAIREYNRVTKRVDDAPRIPVSFEIHVNAPLPPDQTITPKPNEPELRDDSTGRTGENQD